MTSAAANRNCAIVLVACCLLGTVGLLHHPTFHGQSMQHSIEAIDRVRHLNAAVHGGMIALTFVLLLCLAQYNASREQKNFLPRSAMLLFAIGSIAMSMAALINGFIVPDMLADIATQPELANEQSRLIGSVLWSANQHLVAMAAYLMAFAVLFWSADMLANPPSNKVIGIVGILLGVIEITWQTSQHNQFNLHNMQIFWFWLCLWCGIIAWSMWSASKGDHHAK